MSGPSELPSQQKKDVDWVDVGQLCLDPQNPRLPPDLDDFSANSLLKTLADEYDLVEIGQSIADHGYFSEEPLVVVPEDGNLVVVEGNRRLASLKLLNNPAKAPKSYRKKWVALSENRKFDVRQAPILKYEKRSDVVPYLGYRHITGVLPWGAYQKARYIAQLVETSGMQFSEIARTIGSKAPTVREHYMTFTLLRQAQDEFRIPVDRALDAFGVLRKALSNPNIRNFIGLEIAKEEEGLQSPVSAADREAVEELFDFMFGDEKSTRIITDSRQLNRLGFVLAKDATVEVLRATRNLDEAYRLSGGEERRAADVLETAAAALGEAVPLTARYLDSKMVQRAFKKAKTEFEVLERQFPDIDK
ncbi:MAG: hypothetical protein ABJP34_03600 [Erythrobacter sp.]